MKKIREHAAYRSIAGIVLLLVVFSVIVSVIGHVSFTDALMTQYAEGAFMTAQTAMQYLSGDRVDAYVESGGDTEEYWMVYDYLWQVCDNSGSTFVYVIQPDTTDYGHIKFLFSIINPNMNYTVYDFGYVRETTNDDYRTKYRLLYEKQSERELVIRDKGYIETDSHITAMLPIIDSHNRVKAILCVQRQLDALVNVRRTYLTKIFTVLILLLLLVCIGQIVFLNYALFKPLQLISNEALRFSTENVTVDKKLADIIPNRDEIGQLAASIDRMEEQIQSYVENLTRITAEKERINTEIELASRIQLGALPDIFPPFPSRTEFDLYATMVPARGVGGDFYDFFLIDDDHLYMAIADVSGKGIPAALFMMVSKIILANNAMSGKTPAQILTDTNAAILANNREEMFVTVWLGILEISTGRLTAANAGHEYPMVKKPGGDFELMKDRHGFVIGGMDNIKYKEYELQLEPGSRLFVYTDGVPESSDETGSMFGTDGMLRALNEEPDAPLQKVLENVQSSSEKFAKGAVQFDDMTMLCLEYYGVGTVFNSEGGGRL